MAMRAAASAQLTFGLVCIPTKLYLSASADAVHFCMVSPNGNRVKQRYVDELTGDEVNRNDCTKGFEYTKGQLVTFSQEEIKSLDATKTDTIDIKEFVKVSVLDPVMVEKAYYLGADKGGDKGYVLLSRTMERLGVMAIAQWVSRGRDHLVAVAPVNGGLHLYQLYYASEIRDFREVRPKQPAVITDAEDSLAEKLVTMLMGDGELNKYTNGYLDRAHKVIEAKVQGQEVPVMPQRTEPSVLDLYAALKASVENDTAVKNK